MSYNKIWNLLESGVQTMNSLQRATGTTEKSVRNRLGEIQADLQYGGNKSFIVLNDSQYRDTFFSIVPKKVANQKTITVSGRRFRNKGRRVRHGGWYSWPHFDA